MGRSEGSEKKLFVGGLNYDTDDKTLKQYFERWLQWEDSWRKYNIYGNLNVLLGKSWEVVKLMNLLKETGFFFRCIGKTEKR